MMRDRIRLMAAAVLAPAMLFTAAGCGEKRPQEEKVAYKEVEVVRGTFESVITANGVIRPIDRVEIKSKASGEVVDLPVEQGDRVKRPRPAPGGAERLRPAGSAFPRAPHL